MGTLRVDEWQSQFETLPELAQNIWAAAPIPVIAIGGVLLLLCGVILLCLVLGRWKAERNDNAFVDAVLQINNAALAEKNVELTQLSETLKVTREVRDERFTALEHTIRGLQAQAKSYDEEIGRLNTNLDTLRQANARVNAELDVERVNRVAFATELDKANGELSKLKAAKAAPSPAAIPAHAASFPIDQQLTSAERAALKGGYIDPRRAGMPFQLWSKPMEVQADPPVQSATEDKGPAPSDRGVAYHHVQSALEDAEKGEMESAKHKILAACGILVGSNPSLTKELATIGKQFEKQNFNCKGVIADLNASLRNWA